jgi:autotransporter adhesin
LVPKLPSKPSTNLGAPHLVTGGTSALAVTNTSVNLTTTNGGFTSNSGATTVQGATSSAMTGGTTSLTVTNSGVNLSGTAGAPVVLSGVANGVAANDAVNLSQLDAVSSKLSGGIAMAMAMTQMPTPQGDHRFAVGMAVGNYNDETAIAIGGTALLDDNWALRGAISKSNGQTGAGLGLGYSW